MAGAAGPGRPRRFSRMGHLGRRRPRRLGPTRRPVVRPVGVERAVSGAASCGAALCRQPAYSPSMAMRPLERDEALQHLFVLGVAVFLIIAPIYLVQPAAAEYSLIGLGVSSPLSTW